MPIFLKISEWIKSENEALPLYILLASSPLPPLTTLYKLKNMGRLDYVKNLDSIFEKEASDNYSNRFKKVLRAAYESQISGDREILVRSFEQELKDIEVSLELADYNISQFYQFISVFTTLMPSIIASVLFFTNGEAALVSLIAFALLALPVSFAGLTIYPLEMHLPLRCKKKFFLAFLLPVGYVILKYIGFDKPALASLILSLPLSLSLYLDIRKLKDVLEEALILVRKAASCPFNIFKCLGIDDPDYLLSEKWYGVAAASTTALYFLILYSGSKVGEYIRRLENFVNRYYEAFKKLRSKTLVMLVYAFIEAGAVALIYGIILVILRYFSSLPTFGYAGVYIPSSSIIWRLEESLDIVLALNAISLSISTSSSREGNPLYSFLYLPFISSLMLIAFDLALIITPNLLGVGI
ncbi:MAG: hypothetical protein DRJ38_01570 [Thermoprotei archaeon]|nr:MAG: hypothetical protein DRJ38_01570 [Thermoprotei archaeon]